MLVPGVVKLPTSLKHLWHKLFVALQVAKKLAADFTNLTGDVLLSAGFIAYLGPYTSTYRERTINLWVQQCRCGPFFLLPQSEGDAGHAGGL